MNNDDDDNEALAARAVAGDAGALALLCERLETPVFRLCLRLLGDVSDAEDAAQDVLIKVITHLSGFEGRSQLMTWVHTIAVRHVLAMKKSRAEERVVDEADFAALLDRGLAFGATAPPGPEDSTFLNEVRLSCTQGMLLLLGREERLALVLVDLLGFDTATAAAIAEVGDAAMRQRLVRARARLAGFLQATCGVANPAATCRCAAQVPAKKARGDGLRFQPLVAGDLPRTTADVDAAASELRSLRIISNTFHEGGAWNAAPSLRARMRQLLPTLLAGA